MSKKINISKKELEAVKTILKGVGQNVDREGLLDTPKRYIKFLKEFCNPDEFNMTVFENESKKSDMVIVSNIPFFSLCEHHLAPFFGTASIGYVPGDKIVGLSKLPRTLDHFSRQPQNQERITQQVANYLMEKLSPQGVGVVIRARHLCVEMRGVKKHDCYTTTSAMNGCFEELNCRQEFLNLIKQ